MNDKAHVGRLSDGRVDFLDQLRAISIISVMANHVRSDLLPGGGVGVGVFFALSGFLIARKLLKTPRNRFAYAGFIVRRVFRVYPLFLLVLALIAVCMRITHPDWFGLFLQTLPRTALLYDGPEGWTGYGIGVLWTLRVEIAFYLSLPMALLILGARAGILIYSLTFTALYASHDLRQFINDGLPIGSYLMLWGAALAVGSLLALIADMGLFDGLSTINGKRVSYAVAGVSAAIYLGLLVVPPTPWEAWHIQVILAAISGCGFVAANMISPLPVLVGLPFIGRISFSMYLLHGALLDYGPAFPRFLQGPGLFLSTILASYLTFKLIERPGIALGEKLARLIEQPTTVGDRVGQGVGDSAS